MMRIQGRDDNIEKLINQLDELNKKFDDYVENTKSFRRKLELEISKMRESGDYRADTLDELLIEWKEL